jgi:hypothetical protein
MRTEIVCGVRATVGVVGIDRGHKLGAGNAVGTAGDDIDDALSYWSGHD